MEIKDVHIVSFEKIRDSKPRGSSGTGYCQYVKLKITYDNHETSEVDIPTFYTGQLQQILALKTHLSTLLHRNMYVVFNDDVVHKFFDCLWNKK